MPALNATSDTAQPPVGAALSRQRTADSYVSVDAGSRSPSAASATTSRRSSRHSRHQSLSEIPKMDLRAVESFLDLAPKARKSSSMRSEDADSAVALPVGAQVPRDNTLPASRLSTGSHNWYTDAANPIVAGLLLRQTIAGDVQPHVSQISGGVQLVHMIMPRRIDDKVATDLKDFGQSRYAATLKFDLKTNQLLKVTYKGTQRPAKDGFYACVVDQNDTLLVSLVSAAKVGAPAGAHAHLAGGLPVRFAGELRIEGGQITWINNASGHYRTPWNLIGQAVR